MSTYDFSSVNSEIRLDSQQLHINKLSHLFNSVRKRIYLLADKAKCKNNKYKKQKVWYKNLSVNRNMLEQNVEC